MKVLFVYYLPSGGVETLNRHRCKALKRNGVDCDLLYLNDGAGRKNITDIPVFITNRNDEIKGILDQGNYDAIVVCSDHHFLARVRNLNYRGKVIYEIQGLGEEHVAERWLKHAQSIVKANANALLYPKTSHIDQICSTYYAELPKFCFNNCFDTSTFSYKLLPKETSPIIGWVGRLEPNKNWRLLLEIAHQLFSYRQDLQLWMFEDATLASPSERENFEDLLDKYNLRSNLTIRSNIPNEEMATYYSRIADSGGFLCSTSKIEGFGYAIVEAMSCRCPVLTTDSDGVRSFIVHNKTGKFIHENNLDETVEQALELMTNKKLRDEISQNGLNHIVQHLNPDTYTQNFKSMLDQL